jgi:hypothetical protein
MPPEAARRGGGWIVAAASERQRASNGSVKRPAPQPSSSPLLEASELSIDQSFAVMFSA